jgi:MFS family permease
LPSLVERKEFPRAVNWNASTFQMSSIIGPVIAGVVVRLAGHRAWPVYALNALTALVFCLLISRVRKEHRVLSREPMTFKTLLTGFNFVFANKIIIGTITLDMFSVLLGGATALLPVYADQILHVGPAGFGWLRAAPSLGAITMAVWVAHRPPLKRPGHTLLWAVAGFGAAVVAFGISRWFWLSLAALFVTGALDNISVVVRQSLVQLLTPDALRGRVTAVNQIFIGSSNEIGALRAGLMAALIGPVAAVVWGGLGTVAVTGAIARAVPTLRRLAPLHTLKTGG